MTSVLLSKTDAVMMNNNFRIHLCYPKTSVVIIFTKYVTGNMHNTDFRTIICSCLHIYCCLCLNKWQLQLFWWHTHLNLVPACFWILIMVSVSSGQELGYSLPSVGCLAWHTWSGPRGVEGHTIPAPTLFI